MQHPPPHNPPGPKSLAALIDHTLLKPEASRDQVIYLCREALLYGFASVCLGSSWVPLAREIFSSTGLDPGLESKPHPSSGPESKLDPPQICTVVGFPHGNSASIIKTFEAEWALRAGAQEIDMVVPLGALKEHDWTRVEKDIASVLEAIPSPYLLKVIIETGILTHEEKVTACKIVRNSGAAFIKTCTGFNKGQASIEDVALLRQMVGPQMGVKASGGIRTYNQAKALIEAGANRLGTSSGVQIIKSL